MKRNILTTLITVFALMIWDHAWAWDEPTDCTDHYNHSCGGVCVQAYSGADIFCEPDNADSTDNNVYAISGTSGNSVIWGNNGTSQTDKWCCDFEELEQLHIDTGDGQDFIQMYYGNDYMWQYLADITMGDNFNNSGGEIKGSDYVQGGCTGYVWADDITVGHGQHKIWAGLGRDLISFEDGDTSSGYTRLGRGEGGCDWIFGGDLDDELHGGTGPDRIVGGKGDDEIYGDGGDDEIFGGMGDDYIEAADNDVVEAGNGEDIVIGSDYAEIYGETHSDILCAEDSGVTLYGGLMRGTDVCYGCSSATCNGCESEPTGACPY